MKNWKKELTIGSWVKRVKDGMPLKVEFVNKKKIGYHVKPHEHTMHFIRLSEVAPIFVTREILLANGFFDVNVGTDTTCVDGGTKKWNVLPADKSLFKRPNIEFAMSHNLMWDNVLIKPVNGLTAWHDRYTHDFIFEMWHVHKLQMLMKLRHQYDFADNFIINVNGEEGKEGTDA